MANFYEIPLSATPQKFVVTLGGVDYQFRLTYANVDSGGWILDISDKQGVPIVQGIPLVTGSNLLEQYPHLGFSGRLWVQGSTDPDAVPAFDNLGSGSVLFWVTD